VKITLSLFEYGISLVEGLSLKREKRRFDIKMKIGEFR